MGEVEILGPYQPGLKLLFARILNQLFLVLSGKRISYRHSKFISRAYGTYFSKKLKGKTYDYIIAPAASAEIAYLQTQVPVIYITDGTFAGCLNYHKSLTHLTDFSIKEGNEVEQLAITKSSKIIVSSEWCRNSVINDYKAPVSSVVCVPYGANFENLPAVSSLTFEVPAVWKLLFVGVYWESKGGDIAYNAFKILAEKGYNVSLTVLGCVPPAEISHPRMTVIPFIDKNDPEGQKRLVEIYARHSVLILPTRFDCTPIVINEASAFGIPCLVANSGGVAGHLKEGRNGYLLDYADKGEGYAAKTEALINAPNDYLELRKQTRKLFEEELNWEHWIKELRKLL